MVKEGIVLGHHILEKGIEVDRAKVEVIERLPPPISLKGVRSFLGHASFFWTLLLRISKKLHILYSNYLRKNVNSILMKLDRKHLES